MISALPFVLLLLMLLLMALRAPLWVAMLIPGALGYVLISGVGPLLGQLKGLVFARFSIYDLSVIPLFLLMGHLASQGGLSAALFRCAAAFVGHWRGGLAQASVLACAVFGAVCGSSVATAATVSSVALPEMKRFGYDGGLATATLAAGGTLGILIPPSVVLVVYAILTEQNIAKLFAAAMLPGLIAVLGYGAALALLMRFRPQDGPAQARQSWRARGRSALQVWPVLLIFVLVFGGIYGGVFTATEGAAVGVLLTLGVSFFVGDLRRAGLMRAVLATAQTSAMIFLIFIGADLLNSALALTQMPARLATLVGELGWPPLAVIAAILLFYIVLGGVMDELSMLLLTLPVLFPLVMQLELHGLGPEQKALWFGMLVLCVVNIGLIAPPVGLNVYVVNGLAKEVPLQVPMARTYKYVFVFLGADVLRMVLLLSFPVLSLWLVRWV